MRVRLVESTDEYGNEVWVNPFAVLYVEVAMDIVYFALPAGEKPAELKLGPGEGRKLVERIRSLSD